MLNTYIDPLLNNAVSVNREERVSLTQQIQYIDGFQPEEVKQPHTTGLTDSARPQFVGSNFTSEHAIISLNYTPIIEYCFSAHCNVTNDTDIGYPTSSNFQ